MGARGIVAIVGVGGLGTPAAAALCRAGGMQLRLIDPDEVERSNLPRQILFGTSDVGTPKVDAAAARISARIPTESRQVRLSPVNADELLGDATTILDGSDSVETKFLLNEVAVRHGTPLIHAGAVGLDGQLMTIVPGRSACLRCLFQEIPVEDDLPTCQQSGIIGPVVGVIGLAAAREATALARGERSPLEGRLATYDGRTSRWRSFGVPRRPGCTCCDAAA